MAESVGSLYMSLGLDLSELETGLVAVDRTVNENVRRLNRQADLIQLRAEIEIAGLDEVADAERILEIRQRALNDQMAAQRDRVRLLDAELRRLTAAHGENSVAVERATIRLERERLALANLERDLRGLNDSTEESSSIFDGLSDMLPEIPTKFQAIGIAASAITAGFGAAATAVQDLLEQFRELQNQSYELNMSLPDTKQFLRQVKLGGGDIGDIEGYIRGITDAYVKGEYDDPEFIALRKYGAQITDATGRLKDFKDIVDEVYQAWEKADAAGEGIEFLQLTGGESGVRDIIQYFQRLKEAREDASKIFNADINTDQLHELDRAFGRLEEQSSELKAAIGDIFVPAAQAAAEKLFDTVRDGTQTLVENKDAIQRWGFIAAETFSTIESKFDSTFGDTVALTPSGYLDNARKALRDLYDAFRDPNEFRQANWLDGKELPWGEIFGKLPRDIGYSLGIIQRAEERQRAYNAELSETRTAAENAAQGIDGFSDGVTEAGDVLSQYGAQRVQQFKDELEDLNLDLQFGDDEYGKANAQNDLWLQRELTDKLQASNEERETLLALHAAKAEKIERDHQEELNRIREEAEERANQHFENAADIQFRMTHTAFEKELRDIDLWKDAQLEKAETAREISGVIAESASKEAEAFERSVDRMKGKMQSLEDKIFAQEHSQYEQDVRRAQQEYYRQYRDFQKEGMLDDETKGKLDYWYINEIRALENKASKARSNEGDNYLKRPESAQGRTLELGVEADEAKIQNQLAQQLSGEGKELVDQMFSLGNSAQTASEAQDSLAQSAQQTSDTFQKIEGDRIVDDIKNLSTSTQQLTELQAQLAEATKDGISAFQGSEQNTASKQADMPNQPETAKTTQNRLAEKVRESVQNLKDGSNTSTTAKSTPLNTDKAHGENPVNSRSFFEKNFEDTRGNTTKKFSSDTTTETAPDLLTPLTNISETVQNILGELQNRQDEGESTNAISELQSEVSTQLSEVATQMTEGASQVSESITSPIESLSQALSEIQTQNAEQGTAESEGTTYLENVASTVQSIWDDMQAAKETETAETPDTDDTAAKLANIDTNVAAIWQKMSEETTAETPTETPQDSELSRLATIDNNVATILQDLQATKEVEGTDETANLANIDTNVATILQSMQEANSAEASPLANIDTNVSAILQSLQETAAREAENALNTLLEPLQRIDSPLSSITQAIADKEVTIQTETIVQPLNNITGLIDKILSALANREPPKVEISPQMDIDLGGAYVFDNAMKQSLVDDITSNIVSRITEAVERATSRSSYSY